MRIVIQLERRARMWTTWQTLLIALAVLLMKLASLLTWAGAGLLGVAGRIITRLERSLIAEPSGGADMEPQASTDRS